MPCFSCNKSIHITTKRDAPEESFQNERPESSNNLANNGMITWIIDYYISICINFFLESGQT